MNFFQRIIILIGAIAFVLVLITSPKIMYTPDGQILKYEQRLENKLITRIDLRIAMFRGILVLVITILIYAALHGKIPPKTDKPNDHIKSSVITNIQRIYLTELRRKLLSSELGDKYANINKTIDKILSKLEIDNHNFVDELKELLSNLPKFKERSKNGRDFILITNLYMIIDSLAMIQLNNIKIKNNNIISNSEKKYVDYYSNNWLTMYSKICQYDYNKIQKDIIDFFYSFKNIDTRVQFVSATLEEERIIGYNKRLWDDIMSNYPYGSGIRLRLCG